MLATGRGRGPQGLDAAGRSGWEDGGWRRQDREGFGADASRRVRSSERFMYFGNFF